MAGGFFEGFKKIYTGKNIFSKHLFLLLLSILVSLPCAIAALANNSGTQADIYKYIYFEYPLLGIICTIISLIIGLYMIHFMHNSIKYLIWKDTQSDEEKIKALDIMPDINLILEMDRFLYNLDYLHDSFYTVSCVKLFYTRI